MKTSVRPSERRVSRTQDLILTIAQRFTDATGWPMEFVLADEVDGEEPWLAEDNGLHVWRSEVHDGRHLLGYLCLRLPGDPKYDRAYLMAQSLAELVCELINRICSLGRTLETRTRELSTLVELGLRVPRESDVLDAVVRLLRAVTELTGFRAVAFFLLDPSTRRLNLRVSHQLDGQCIPEPERDLVEEPPDLKVLVKGKAFLRRGQPGADRWLPPNAALAVGIPVATRNGPIGTLWCYDRRSRAVGDHELHILRSLAAQIALILERVVLLKESEAQHRLQRELQIISENQPCPKLDRLPEDSGFEAALKIDSRHELGGDLCEVIPVGHRRTVIVVGDASGDSIPAAIVMTSVRGALRALATGIEEDLLQPDVVVDRVNRALFSLTPPHQFMTFFYGLFDANTRAFRYSNAGHPVPLLIRRGQVFPLESHGLILGILDTARYGSSQLDLQPSDTLIFYSDGISEAMNRRQEMFRTDGVVQAALECPDGSASDILNAIWRRYQEHIQGAAEPDDRTLLVLKVK